MLFLNQARILLGVAFLCVFCGCSQSSLRVIKDENGNAVAVLNPNEIEAIVPDGKGSFAAFRDGKGYHISADLGKVSEQIQ